MKNRMQSTNFIWLTLALIGMMVGGGLSQELPDNVTLRVVEWTSLVLILLSLLSLNADRRWGNRFLILMGGMLLLVLARNYSSQSYFEYGYLCALLVFFGMASWIVGRQVILTGSVDINKIVGSVALYIMIGLIWSIIYTMLLEIQPDALKGIEPAAWFENLSACTYFSFVTLTTLGYGDISPTTALAESLVVLEAITGMFYMAIIVASLVGALQNRKTN